jgi:hypothetical protein
MVTIAGTQRAGAMALSLDEIWRAANEIRKAIGQFGNSRVGIEVREGHSGPDDGMHEPDEDGGDGG